MPLLEVRGLEKTYGQRRVVAGVDFHVGAGEIVGLLGPNGAGRRKAAAVRAPPASGRYGRGWFRPTSRRMRSTRCGRVWGCCFAASSEFKVHSS